MSVQPGRTNTAQVPSSCGVGYQPLPAPRVLSAAEQHGAALPPRSMTAVRLSVELRAARHRIRELEQDVTALRVELARRPAVVEAEAPTWAARGIQATQYGHPDLGGDWTLDTNRVRLVGPSTGSGGLSVKVSNTECLLLAMLASAPGVVAWDRLIAALFGTGTPVQDAMHGIRIHIARLRGKLRRTGATGRIENVQGLGYIWEVQP